MTMEAAKARGSQEFAEFYKLAEAEDHGRALLCLCPQLLRCCPSTSPRTSSSRPRPACLLLSIRHKDNGLEQRRRFGGAVVYGQIVQLFHTQSQRYLRVSSAFTSEGEAK